MSQVEDLHDTGNGADAPGASMEFRILGPLEVLAPNGGIDLGAPRQRIVLASLVLQANRVVSFGHLVEAIYGDNAPPTSRVQIQICVSALRRLLAGHGHPDAIQTYPTGYRLRVEAGNLDLHQYEALIAEARQARDARRLTDAGRGYRTALGKWRGPALRDVESAAIRAIAHGLDERRLAATEECIEVDLGLGRHREVIPELTELTMAYPLRERLRGLLMIALHRSERQADALDTYRDARRTLIDELGLEPGDWLRRLEHGILTGDPTLAQPSTPAPPVVTGQPAEAEPAPRLLPTDISDFTGRDDEVRLIEEQLTGGGPQRTAVPVVVLTGGPGTGKSALAVHVAHRLRDRFPDGQLFVDLHGRRTERVSAAEALQRFLRALGVPPGAIPDGVDERAEVFRDRIAHRRLLIVLDDAAGESQVVSLLPGDCRSAVIVTSRSPLAAIPGATNAPVGPLPPQHAVALLRHIVGPDRVDREPGYVLDLARLCGHLPLALRVAGARLASRPHWYVADLVDRLADERRRLDELAHAGICVRSSLTFAYESLCGDARRLLRLLVLVSRSWVSPWVGAALLDVAPDRAQDVLDKLSDAQFLETTQEPGGYARYRLHELVRVFARERLAAEESPAERHAALERYLDAVLTLLAAVERGNRRVSRRPRGAAPIRQFSDQTADRIVTPVEQWYELEHHMVLAAVRQAAQAGLVGTSVELAAAVGRATEALPYADHVREAHRIALSAARRAGDQCGEAAVLYASATLSMAQLRTADAVRELLRAMELSGEVDDVHGCAEG
ncbi:BTAD domain-containing putative transcriptional regulator [Micromonospora andamanensis]|uniref:SARP family transcriptional regulator n=1 Tax=Micromonospora andamanensis TaxID=1287068 RepID=A0ABQ4HTF0_9ACTN|nr:BTAD domain-containing putative transcriptional regulator [Micromonospora andamanensis]GIJ08911.1 SARP family transcriptional regulator [Micromonospora andamanensis]